MRCGSVSAEWTFFNWTHVFVLLSSTLSNGDGSTLPRLPSPLKGTKPAWIWCTPEKLKHMFHLTNARDSLSDEIARGRAVASVGGG